MIPMNHTTRTLITLLTLILIAVLAACSAPQPADPDATLTVTIGENEMAYSRADLQEMDETTVEAEGTAYVGVPLSDLLQDALASAGVGNPEELSEVTAVASDGYSAAYEPDLFLSPQTIVAYATSEGDLADDEQPFRMVLSDQPGRMNVRMLARIEAAP